jgi:hypothetical protein
MNQAKLMNLAIAGGIVFAACKYGNSVIKAGALGVAGMIAARQIPCVRDYV